jgi:uncharacterized protein YdhG (YjbR/CyaY superfamily)
MKTTFNNIDEYIETQTLEAQTLLEQIRQTITQAAPQAEEVISYNMPAFKYKGILVYFAACKNHIGFYATPTGHEEFKKELSNYKQGKGSVQFPMNQALPLDLISKMVKFRLQEKLKQNPPNSLSTVKS